MIAAIWAKLRAGGSRLGGRLLGTSGERAAAEWLRRRGYRVLDRNYSPGDDEVDLIALDPDGRTVVLVEVKTRASDAGTLPEEHVGRTKRHRLSRVAARLQQSRRYAGRPMRFDVIAIVWPEGQEPRVKHIPGAFESTF